MSAPWTLGKALWRLYWDALDRDDRFGAMLALVGVVLLAVSLAAACLMVVVWAVVLTR